jgi:hypothetical protein
MNKKIIKLGILLVFIFSCNVSTSNNNVEVKPTTSVSSNNSVLPTVTPSVQITTNPTNNITVEITPNPILSPTITPTPTAIATPYVEIRNFEQNFELNKERDGIENGYDGKVLIIIDTYLLKEYIESEEELHRMKRKVMILKDSYDELSDYDKELLKKEYGEYSIFDPNTYKPIKEGAMKIDSTYEGELSFGKIGIKLNNSYYAYIYRSMGYVEKENSNIIPYDGSLGLHDPFSEKLKSLYTNIKILNKKKLVRTPVQKIVFCSISTLSYYSDLVFYIINYSENMAGAGMSEYSISFHKKSDVWRVFHY